MRADKPARITEGSDESCTVRAPVSVYERVRWSDVDAAGIVCFGKYLRFFELAETELFRRAGLPVSVLLDRYDLWLVRRRVECDFFRPLRLDEAVRIVADVTGVGDSSLQLRFVVEAVDGQDVVAAGRYVLVCVGRQNFVKHSVPIDVRRALEPFLRPPDVGLPPTGAAAP